MGLNRWAWLYYSHEGLHLEIIPILGEKGGGEAVHEWLRKRGEQDPYVNDSVCRYSSSGLPGFLSGDFFLGGGHGGNMGWCGVGAVIRE